MSHDICARAEKPNRGTVTDDRLTEDSKSSHVNVFISCGS